jgi:SAM-dependent methyltransferase
LAWLDPMPLEEDLPLAYRAYFTHQDKPTERGGLVHWLYRALLWTTGLARQRARLRTMYLTGTPPGRLLEVGCGDGTRLAEFQRLGWTVEGQEVDSIAAERAIARGLRVQLGPLTGLALAANSFDAVVLNHVIEHVPEPVPLLRECRRLLKPSGCLLAVTPNIESFGHRRFGSCWMALDPPRHLHLFSPVTLMQLGQNAGFHTCHAWTTAANAQFIAEGSLAIQRTGHHRFGTPPGLRRGIQTLMFQFQALAVSLMHEHSGEECVLKAVP